MKTRFIKVDTEENTDTTYTAGTGLTLSGTEFQNTDKGSDVDLSGLVPYTGAFGC